MYTYDHREYGTKMKRLETSIETKTVSGTALLVLILVTILLIL